MVDVATGHEHSFALDLDVVAAYGAARGLQLATLFLTVLVFYLHDRQLIDCRFLCTFLALPLLRFLLAHSPNHLKEVI